VYPSSGTGVPQIKSREMQRGFSPSRNQVVVTVLALDDHFPRKKDELQVYALYNDY